MLKKLDKKILYTILALVVVGFFIFFSATLRELSDLSRFNSVFLSQFLALLIGLLLMFWLATSKKISKTFWRYKSGYLLLLAVIFQLLLFVPGLGIAYQGALRWISIGGFNFQPSEIVKIAVVLFLAAVTTTLGQKIKQTKNYLYLTLTFVIPVFAFYFFIHDWGTMISILFVFGIIIFMSETRVKHIILSLLVGLGVVFSALWFFVPYGQERLETFLNPQTADSLGSLYQSNQMIMTIGSGQIWGRGFGASLQKFSGLLPEYLSDSIFAVHAEENGFVGAVILIALFLLLTFFSLRAARRLKNSFEKKVVVGLTTIIVFPAFFNMAATMALVPLSGMPIPFVSKGGSVIIANLIAMGIVLFYTRHR